MLEEQLIKLGYKKTEMEIIINAYPLNVCKKGTLEKRIKQIWEYLLSLGYTKEEIIKMTIRKPITYSYSVENMKQKLEDIISLGYTKEEAIKMIKKTFAIYSYSIISMKQKIEYMMSLGYTREEVIRMTISLPSLYATSITTIKQKLEDIKSLGYTKEEVIRMTILSPPMYSYNITNMKQRLEDIISLGYTKEEVIKMTISLPALYGLSIENIKQKIEFYDSIELHGIPIKTPKFLMQSVELSYARYEFLKEKNIEINMDNYRKLFMSQQQFKKQYGITKEELLTQYDYNERGKNGYTILSRN